MDKNFKIKYRKKENKYVVQYYKVKNKLEQKYQFMKSISDANDLVLFIDTAMAKIVKENVYTEYLDLSQPEVLEQIAKYLADRQIEHQYRTIARKVPIVYFGISTRKTKKTEDNLLVVVLPKRTLDQELFQKLLCTNDYKIGINPKKEVTEIMNYFLYEDFDGEYFEQAFEYTLVDSNCIEQYYTSYPLNQ